MNWAWLYLLNNDFPFEANVRRTSSKVYASSSSDLTNDGYRNDQGGQDSNIDEDDDDMSRLQETEATYADRGEEEGERTRPSQERNWAEEDYYANLEQEREHDGYRYPDRYGWDQYGGGYYY